MNKQEASTSTKMGQKEDIIRLNLKWFSVLAEKRGSREEEYEVSQRVRIRELMDALEEEFTELQNYRPHIRVAVNQEYADSDTWLNDGDEVAFITPVSGG